MRTTFRLSLAAVLLIAAAGIARAQDTSAAPPPVAPDLGGTPVADLPVIPFAGPAPATEPAQTIDQSAIAVEPVAAPPVEPAQANATEKTEKSQVTTTAKHAAKKTVKKPAENPMAEVNGPVKPAAAAAILSAADASANPPPPNAAASAKAEPAKSVAPLPPSANPVPVETLAEEPRSERKMGVGSWFLLVCGIAGLFTVITLFWRRKGPQPSSIVQLSDLSLDPEPVPVPTRP